MERTQNPIENKIEDIAAIAAEQGMRLEQRPEGVTLIQADGQELRGDFVRLIPRVRGGIWTKEFLVKAAKVKILAGRELTAIDATAGLGDDSFFLAAAGFQVTMYERNPVIFALLNDAIERAKQVPELAGIASRMHAFHADSIEEMKKLAEALKEFDEADAAEAEAGNDNAEDGAKAANRPQAPDIVLLDPMFPERQKSALVKKKLQMIQKLETPCDDEIELMQAAMSVRPRKLIIKRPPKGPYLADIKPDHSIEGKAVRFDCITSPYDRMHKFFK